MDSLQFLADALAGLKQAAQNFGACGGPHETTALEKAARNYHRAWVSRPRAQDGETAQPASQQRAAA